MNKEKYEVAIQNLKKESKIIMIARLIITEELLVNLIPHFRIKVVDLILTSIKIM